MEVSTLPTALVTGSPERVPDIAIALKSAGFDILAAEAILRDCGRTGVRATVVGEHRAPEEIAALASHRPPEPLPWWLYASVDPDLDFADWRNSVLCLASMRGA